MFYVVESPGWFFMSAHAAPGVSVISIIKLVRKKSRRDKVFCEGFFVVYLGEIAFFGNWVWGWEVMQPPGGAGEVKRRDICPPVLLGDKYTRRKKYKNPFIPNV